MTANRTDALSQLSVLDLSLHPAGENVPRMRPEEWIAFLADVSRRGVVEPITVQKGGVILDGRHRFEAAQSLLFDTIPARFVDISKSEQVDYVVRAAVLRRHLTDSQRAMLAAQLKGSFEHEAAERKKRKPKGSVPENLPEQKGDARDLAGEAVGVSGKSVDSAAKVFENGSSKLIEAVKSGEMAVSSAAKLAELPKAEQNAALADGPEAIKKAVEKSPSEQAKQDPHRLWHKGFHDIRVILNSIRDQGGVKKLSAKWSPAIRDANAKEVRRIIAELEKLAESLEDS